MGGGESNMQTAVGVVANEMEGPNQNNNTNNINNDNEDKKKKEEVNNVIKVTAAGLGAIEVATDLTTKSIDFFQKIANKVAGTTYEIIKVGEYKVFKGFTVDALGRKIAYVGVLVSAADIYNNGLNWQNGTDAFMSAASSVPVVGWVVGAAYFVGDPILKATTGKNLSNYLEDAFNEGKRQVQKFVSDISNLESSFRNGTFFRWHQ